MSERRRLSRLENDEVIQLYISNDGLKAELVIKKPIEEHLEEYQDLREYLTEKGIKFGLVKDTLNEWPNILKKPGRYPVAQGKRPERGKDGFVKVLFQQNVEKKIAENEDGRIDYFDMIKVPEVRAGDILAELIPPEEGTPGKDVMDQEIAPRAGREARLSKGKNVKLSGDGKRVIAETAGRPALIGKAISVFLVFEVQGDVDVSTGNINFIGSVTVRGTVRDGFSIQAGGDIEVWSNVEGATLEAEGNILIRGGVFGGGKGRVCAKGDASVRIVENGNIEAMQNVLIGEAVLHSSISAGRRVVVQGAKGLIAGGTVKAGELVWAKTIGSPMGTRTDVVVGISPAVREEHARLKKEAEDARKAIEAAEKAFTVTLRRQQSGKGVDDRLRQVLAKFKESHNLAKEKERLCQQRISELEELFKEFEGKVLVENRIYPQARIVLRNISYVVRDEITYASFQEKEGEIAIGSFEKPRLK